MAGTFNKVISKLGVGDSYTLPFGFDYVIAPAEADDSGTALTTPSCWYFTDINGNESSRFLSSFTLPNTRGPLGGLAGATPGTVTIYCLVGEISIIQYS